MNNFTDKKSCMNFLEYDDYIYDNNFSADLHVKYYKTNKIIEKKDYLRELLLNKKIIDLGFTDHFEIIDERIKNKTWVHADYRSWSSDILGVDINEKAINYIKEKLKFDDIYYHDITSPVLLQPILEKQWDYLIMSEVLEHIPDPALFLKKIKENYGNNINRIIITVPNAFGAITLRSVFKNVERINSDHKFWFTPYTLAKVAVSAGLKVEEFCLCNSYYKLNFWERMLIKRSPLFHHTLAMVVKL